MRQIMLGAALPAGAKRQWQAWMVGNVVGRVRLRAAFPADWIAGDRTGTGDGICNDFAFAERPGTDPLLLSAYYTVPGMGLSAQEGVLRDVARLAVAWQDPEA